MENYYNISPSKWKAFSNNVLVKLSPGIIIVKPALEFYKVKTVICFFRGFHWELLLTRKFPAPLFHTSKKILDSLENLAWLGMILKVSWANHRNPFPRGERVGFPRAAPEGLNYHSFLTISYHLYEIANVKKCLFFFFANSIKLNILWDIRWQVSWL